MIKLRKQRLESRLNKRLNKVFSSLIIDSSESVSKITKGRIIYICLSVIFLLIIQEAVFNHLRILDAKPNMTIVFLYTISVILHVRPAMFAGLFAGLYVDVMYGRYLGVYALLFMLFAAFVSVISFEQVKLKSIWSLSIAIPSFLICTMVESFTAKLITLARTGGTVLYENYGLHMVKRILPVTLYDVIIFFILFVPIRLIWDKLGPKYEIF